MQNLKDKVFLITGAGSGIGKALAQLLDARGVTLILNDINEQALKNVTQSLVQSPLCLPFSVAKKQHWLDAKATIDMHFKNSAYSGIDGIINNAGIAHDTVNLDQMRDEDFMAVMDVNFYGVLFGTQVFLPELKTKQEAWVVNISSIFGVSAVGRLGAYCASKFAVRGLSESLRMDALDSFAHVIICVVHPGGIATPIASNAIVVDARRNTQRQVQIQRFNQQLKTTPEAAALAIVKGIVKKSPRVLIGADAKILDWIVRIFPSRYTQVIFKELKKRGLFT